MAEATARVGLRALAAALPRWRVERAVIGQAWGRRAAPGSRPVCGHDEDSLTLAGDAAAAAGAGGVGVLLLASTTAPLAERAPSGVIARALRLDDSIIAADLGGSVRAGVVAGVQAARWAAGGTEALVLAADRRDVEPGGDLEPLLGDAGVAARLGPTAAGEDLAVLLGTGCLAGDTPESWRLPGDRDLRRADPAFAPRQTLPGPLAAAITRALAAAGLEPSGVTHLAAPADARSLRAAAAGAGLGEATVAVAERLAGLVGLTGCAGSWLALAAALGQAAPGEVVVQAAAAEGSAEALVWRVGEGVDAWRRGGGGLPESLDHLQAIPSYARFLRLRGALPAETAEPYSSLPLVAREMEQNLELSGSECPDCGRFTFPMRRICEACGCRGLRPRALGRTGTVVTFTEDHIVPNPEPPTVMAVAEMEGGGRFYGQLGAAPGVARRGLPVELVLRRLHDAGGWPHYFWKMRPMAAAAGEEIP